MDSETFIKYTFHIDKFTTLIILGFHKKPSYHNVIQLYDNILIGSIGMFEAPININQIEIKKSNTPGNYTIILYYNDFILFKEIYMQNQLLMRVEY